MVPSKPLISRGKQRRGTIVRAALWVPRSRALPSSGLCTLTPPQGSALSGQRAGDLDESSGRLRALAVTMPGDRDQAWRQFRRDLELHDILARWIDGQPRRERGSPAGGHQSDKRLVVVDSEAHPSSDPVGAE